VCGKDGETKGDEDKMDSMTTTNEIGHSIYSGKSRKGKFEIQVCPIKTCDHKDDDPLPLVLKLNETLRELALPRDVKITVSGCIENCAKCFFTDIGILARDGAYLVSFGGGLREGRKFGEVVAQNLDPEEAVALIEKCIAFFGVHSKNGESTPQFLARMGLSAIQEAVL
jgi:NAD(P)H-nitrite reductase large subunit